MTPIFCSMRSAYDREILSGCAYYFYLTSINARKSESNSNQSAQQQPPDLLHGVNTRALNIHKAPAVCPRSPLTLTSNERDVGRYNQVRAACASILTLQYAQRLTCRHVSPVTSRCDHSICWSAVLCAICATKILAELSLQNDKTKKKAFARASRTM